MNSAITHRLINLGLALALLGALLQSVWDTYYALDAHSPARHRCK